MRVGNRTLGARLRVVLGPDVAIGPGKAGLLDAIKATGSIAAAGRRTGMSYRRAWFLVDTMNACFRTPLVETSRGGTGGGGHAGLTELGEEVLSRFRRMEQATAMAVEPDMAALRDKLAPHD
ncbi:MAG: LysR family transcriptional regulator [Alphaproteobacteria bacterium]|nr:LysR family transcriptional regulator [Alphaproteobacteria bacterium]